MHCLKVSEIKQWNDFVNYLYRYIKTHSKIHNVYLKRSNYSFFNIEIPLSASLVKMETIPRTNNCKYRKRRRRVEREQVLGHIKSEGERRHNPSLFIRRMKETCYSETCRNAKNRNCEMFSEEIRREIFEHCWKTLDWNQRKRFLDDLIERRDVDRPSSYDQSRRSCTYDYYLPKIIASKEKLKVCRNMFANTLGYNRGFKLNESMLRGQSID